jgi:hypothetical protein
VCNHCQWTRIIQNRALMSGYLLLTRIVSRLYSPALCTKSLTTNWFLQSEASNSASRYSEFYCDAEIPVDYGNAVHRSLPKAVDINAALWGHHRPGNSYRTGCISVFVSNHIDMYMAYRPFISYDLGHRTAHAPHKFVTSRRGYWLLLIRVSCITWRISMLLETLSFICVT